MRGQRRLFLFKKGRERAGMTKSVPFMEMRLAAARFHSVRSHRRSAETESDRDRNDRRIGFPLAEIITWILHILAGRSTTERTSAVSRSPTMPRRAFRRGATLPLRLIPTPRP